jgi:hypothetical protein
LTWDNVAWVWILTEFWSWAAESLVKGWIICVVGTGTSFNGDF